MKNNKPFFSIIIPVYNTSKYLKECVNSVLEQKFNDYEILLLNDGSTDDSGIICDEIQKNNRNVKVFHNKNVGAGATRNFGIRHSKGKYIFFLDSDDYIIGDLLRYSYNILTKKNYDILCFGYKTICNNNEQDFLIKTPFNEYNNSQIKKELLPKMIVTMPKEEEFNLHFNRMCIISRSLIDENNWRFESEIDYISEDLVSLIDLFYNAKIIYVLRNAYYVYRMNSDSLSHNYRNRLFPSLNRMICHLIKSDSVKYDKNYHIRFRYLYFSYTISSLKQLVKSNLTFKEKYKNILKISKDDFLKNNILCYNYLNPLSRKIFFNLIKREYVILLYIILKLRK